MLLACVGYGALFLLVGLFLRSPVIPAVFFFFWEGFNAFLPGLLKKISVIFYLQALFPVNVSDGPFEIIVEPVSMWLAIPGFLVFTTGILFLTALRIRRMEVHYAGD